MSGPWPSMSDASPGDRVIATGKLNDGSWSKAHLANGQYPFLESPLFGPRHADARELQCYRSFEGCLDPIHFR